MPEVDGLSEGAQVRVTKRLRFQDDIHPVVVEGRLLQTRRVRTESSFVGADEGRFWVHEVVIEKPDGERSAVVIDQHTRIEVLSAPAGGEAGSSADR